MLILESGVPYAAEDAISLDEWLNDKTNERDVLIMRLRYVERELVKHGRLKRETLPPTRERR